MKAIFVNDTRSEMHYGCKLVVENLTRFLAESGVIVQQYIGLEQRRQVRLLLESGIDAVDLVVINGEGTLHSDRQAAYDILDAAVVAVERGKPFILLNSTWRKNSSQLAERLRGAFFVGVREYPSMLELKAADIAASVLPDAVFLTTGLSLYESGKSGTMLFSDSVLPEVSIQMEAMRRRFNGKPVSIFYAKNRVSFLWERIRSSPKRSILKNPLLAIPLLASYVSASRGITQHLGQLQQHFLEANVVITGRFHMVCILIMMRVPFYAVESNTSKISSMLKDVGIEGRCFSDVKELESMLASGADVAFSSLELAAIDAFLSRTAVGYSQLHETLSVLCSGAVSGIDQE